MDGDLISRSALLDEFGEDPFVWFDHDLQELQESSDWAYYTDLVRSAPAVDAVEVVRCKDCKHFYDTDINLHHKCKRGGSQVWDVKFTENDFCSYGERRADNA